MALDDCDLDEVTAWIGSDTAVPDRWLYDLNAGAQLRRDAGHDSNPLWSDLDSKSSSFHWCDGGARSTPHEAAPTCRDAASPTPLRRSSPHGRSGCRPRCRR